MLLLWVRHRADKAIQVVRCASAPTLVRCTLTQSLQGMTHLNHFSVFGLTCIASISSILLGYIIVHCQTPTSTLFIDRQCASCKPKCPRATYCSAAPSLSAESLAISDAVSRRVELSSMIQMRPGSPRVVPQRCSGRLATAY